MDYGLARKGVGLSEYLTRIPMVWVRAWDRAVQCWRICLCFHGGCDADTMRSDGCRDSSWVQGRSLWPLLQGQEYPREEFRSIYATVGVGGLYYEASDHVSLTIPFAPNDPARGLLCELLMWTLRAQDSLPTGPQGPIPDQVVNRAQFGMHRIGMERHLRLSSRSFGAESAGGYQLKFTTTLW